LIPRDEILRIDFQSRHVVPIGRVARGKLRQDEGEHRVGVADDSASEVLLGAAPQDNNSAA
jgi:hypothetical protein